MKAKLKSLFKLKHLSIGALFFLSFGLGFLRASYVLNFSDPAKPFFIERTDLTSGGIVHQMDIHTRWFSLLFYSFLFILITSCISYLLYKKKKHVMVAICIYATMIMFALIFSVLGYFQNIQVALSIANKIKNLIQEPFLCFLIIAYCLYDGKWEKIQTNRT